MGVVATIRLLKDGSGRVCIHWFKRADPLTPIPSFDLKSIPPSDTPITTPSAVVALTPLGPLTAGGVRGKIVCQPGRQSVSAAMTGEGWMPLCHSDDPRAATCPECLATTEWKDAMAELEGLVQTAAQK